MPTTIVLGQITTEDARPVDAPYRISRDPDHDDVLWSWTATHDGVIYPAGDLLADEGAPYPDAGWFPDAGVYPDGTLLPGPGAARDTIAYTVRVGGSGPSSGKVVAQAGNRCSPNRVCGTRAALNPACSSTGFRVVSGASVAMDDTFADITDGGADGPRTINLYVHTDGQGWS